MCAVFVFVRRRVCECARVRARACARACVRAHVRYCVSARAHVCVRLHARAFGLARAHDMRASVCLRINACITYMSDVIRVFSTNIHSDNIISCGN